MENITEVFEQYLQEDQNDDEFIMCPKNDFAFKLVFGNEAHKNILKGFLSAVLKMPKEEFEDLELLNTELLKEFQEDKKGILDIRVKTKNNEHIDVEIQVLPTKYMTQRTLFYWSKMYLSQIKPGMKYSALNKCITINIIDFEHIPVDKIHTTAHLTEDDTGYRMTEVLEINFLELPKLNKKECIEDTDESILDWLRFINAKSEEVMKMLAKKNEDINEAYNVIKIASKNKEARMAYEARQAEIMDALTREEEAREQGIKIGQEKGEKNKAIEIAKEMLEDGEPLAKIMKYSKLTENEIRELK